MELNKRNAIVDIILALAVILMSIVIYREISRIVSPAITDEEKPGEINAQTVSILPSPQPRVNVGQPTEVPRMDFTLPNLSGQSVAVSDFRGKAVLVNFWATWCAPCRDEMPMIQEYADLYEQDLVVLAVNVGEDEATVQQFVDEFGLDFEILLDPATIVANLYQVYAYPTTMFIDRDGIWQSTHIGELNDVLLSRYLIEIGIEE
jgi:thiol-disulfide isomerase/thioredoxin